MEEAKLGGGGQIACDLFDEVMQLAARVNVGMFQQPGSEGQQATDGASGGELLVWRWRRLQLGEATLSRSSLMRLVTYLTTFNAINSLNLPR